MASIRELMERPERPRLGTFLVEFATPGIGHILKAAGCDFVLFDLEHSGITLDLLKSALRYLEAADLPAIVGLPSRDPHQVGLVLDMGAQAVMSPMVETVAEAQACLERLRYPPAGRRAVALRVAHDRYRARPVPELLAATNAEVCWFAKIETALGVENVDAIAALPGVDGLWIGHVDLTASLGCPGDFADPRSPAAVERGPAGARRHGKPIGRLVGSVEEGLRLHAQGFDFIGYSGDVWILQDGLAAALDALRAGCR
ncbi:MAG: hpch/hpai aldolase [Rhodospirillaceae bacterium]|nr:hpch/hpai aldolase [Rhodospirillaceae bacterium]